MAEKTKMKKSEILALHKSIRDQFEFDRLRMLFGDDYESKCGIVVRQPKIGEILEVGEEKFYKNINAWVTNPTAYRALLWRMGVDWCKLTDFELFCNLYKAMDPDIGSLLFPGTDITTYEQKARVIQSDDDDGEPEYEPVLYSEAEGKVIDNMAYLEISQYLRTLFGIFPKDEYGKGKSTKEAMIWEDEEKARKSDGLFKSSLFPLVSACINHPGFKYRLGELREVGIYEFMDSVNRIQVEENTRALLNGSVSGMADMSKVPKENFNMMRDMYAKDTKKKDDNALKSVADNYSKK